MNIDLENLEISQKSINELKKENEKLKKALDKACEMLEWDCPVEQDLIDDLDCENCNGTYKESWKKYFLNEVKDNEKNYINIKSRRYENHKWI